MPQSSLVEGLFTDAVNIEDIIVYVDLKLSYFTPGLHHLLPLKVLTVYMYCRELDKIAITFKSIELCQFEFVRSLRDSNPFKPCIRSILFTFSY